jgi:WD40 repeat protein
MDGLLSYWDAVSHQPRQQGVVHIRPISAIRFSPDGQFLATSSWDRQVLLRPVAGGREATPLAGHADIVAGCAFAPDGTQLVSWSHDTTVRIWEVGGGGCLSTLAGHLDRVVAAALSPDGRWLASAGRDGTVKLWEFGPRTEVAAVQVGEPRACFFLLDARTLAAVDADGTVLLLSVPGLEVVGRLAAGIRVQAADLSPSGAQVALGGEDGRVHLVTIEGADDAPLVVTPTRDLKEQATVFSRLLGKPRLRTTFRYTCPICRQPTEVERLPSNSFACPHCRRLLRVDGGVRQHKRADTPAFPGRV